MLRFVLDLLLVIISTVIVIKTYRDVISFKNESLIAYVIFITYIFNSLPIAFDIIWGYPDYIPLHSDFGKAARNDTVSIIYDLSIIVAMLSFYLYSIKNIVKENRTEFKANNRFYIIQLLLILSPIIAYFTLVGGLNDLLYSSLIEREGEANSLGLVTNLLYIGLFVFCIRIFGRKPTKLSLLWLLLYLLVLTVISGKRFILAVILIAYFFSFINSKWEVKKRANFTVLIALIGVMFMAFVVYYITSVKVMGDFSGYIYSTLRVDFGREDVTKFVLMREIEGNPILDYRGQTFLSLLLMAVPRAMWPTKPYGHYRYLTAALTGDSPDSIPSGMTPSLYEMSIANFGYLGIIVAIVVLLLIVKFGDRLANPNLKLIVLIVVIQLLTQNLDVSLFIFYVFLFLVITGKHWVMKKSPVNKNTKS